MPTGTEIGAPVSRMSTPRWRPSVEPRATRADAAAAEVLGDLAPEGVGARLAEHRPRHLDAEGVIDQGQVLLGELGVERGADDLRHFAVVGVLGLFHNAFQFS